MNPSDIPPPPERLFVERRILKRDPEHAAWEGRRASKMRERFPVQSQEPVAGASLVAPVQPSITSPNPSGRIV